MSLVLCIGNRNYSSWSLRAWLAMKLSGAACETLRIPLYQADSRARLLQASPTGKVPALRSPHGVIWDSLAIVEYLADTHPDAKLWPEDVAARAFARAMCAEMHSGFAALRSALPMDMRRDAAPVSLEPSVQADIERICTLWRECLDRFGGDGPFLFGMPSAADAFYAPVASRLLSYRVELPDPARAYVQTIREWPAFVEWRDAALVEKEVIEA
ncbi:glutathione S-transferase family protein [Pseudomonas matsuisoli]|uniref:Glutathione S-transferase n=1 Tax=Pseudomonas matsuisoli TaxID=1515666 RepID=A0A917Q3U3_9PSED|nr:glutathione S-transferase family protein [Pseudomonas matsuisoli]GGK07592.1 glutathione S-transferase [Pseudomonas matsuisoli]